MEKNFEKAVEWYTAAAKIKVILVHNIILDFVLFINWAE